MKSILFACGALAVLVSCSKPVANDYGILIGTYTQKGSDGIYYYRLDGEMKNPVQVSATKGVKNPSFLTVRGNTVYAVNEEGDGQVKAYRFNASTGEFELISTQGTGGAHPCHIAATEKWLFAGNYSGGNVSVFPLEEDGTVKERTQLLTNTGSGPVVGRQEKPHIHSVNIHGKEVWVADLGTDEVIVYSLTEQGLVEKKRIAMVPGAGPRHMAFHPAKPVAYLINELNNTVSVIDTEGYKVVQDISTLPAGFEGKSFCADIHVSPDGKFVYGSNRFSNTLVTFAVDQESGALTVVGHTPSGGEVPRNFAISPDGRFVLVAHQETDNIVVFERNKETGVLVATGTEIPVSMPVCVKFL